MAPFVTGTTTPHSIGDDTQHLLDTSYSEITVLASSRAIIEDRLSSATIVISTVTGRIISIFHSVLPESSFPAGTPYTDYSPHILLPGLVDLRPNSKFVLGRFCPDVYVSISLFPLAAFLCIRQSPPNVASILLHFIWFHLCGLC